MLQICCIKHPDLSQHYLNRSQLEEILTPCLSILQVQHLIMCTGRWNAVSYLQRTIFIARELWWSPGTTPAQSGACCRS